MYRRNQTTAAFAAVIFVVVRSMTTPGSAGAQELDSLFGTITVTDISAFPEIVMFTTLRDASGSNIELCGPAGFNLREYDSTSGEILIVEDLEVTLLPTLPGTAISVALVMDTSGSLGTTGSAQARQAAREFITALQPQDRAAIIDFDEDVVLLQPFTNDKQALLAAVEQIDGNGSTSMYDGGIEGLVETSREPGNRNVILFTDGKDTASSSGYDDLIAESADVLIPIHTIAVGNADRSELEDIARETNGTFREGQLGELGGLYNEITRQIRSQYRLVFTTPHGTAVNLRRELQLQISCGGKDTFANTRYVARTPLQISPTAETQALFEARVTVAAGDDVTLRFTITGNPQSARLLYRTIGEAIFHEIQMDTLDGTAFESSIPGADTLSPGIECYVLATTDDGVTRSFPDSRYEPTIRGPQIIVDVVTPPSVTLTTPGYEKAAPVLVSAHVDTEFDDTPSVELLYRAAGQREYRAQRMNHLGENDFSAELDPSFATDDGIECVVIATDTRGVRGTTGQLQAPLLLPPMVVGPQCTPTGECGNACAIPSMMLCSAIGLNSIGRRRRRAGRVASMKKGAARIVHNPLKETSVMFHQRHIRTLILAFAPCLLLVATGTSCPSVCGTNAGLLFTDQDEVVQDLVVNQGGLVSITFASEDFDPFLELYDDRMDLIATDDDSGDGNTALLTQALRAGTYRLIARPYRNGREGAYLLSASGDACIAAHIPGPNEVDRDSILYLGSEQYWSFSLFDDSKVVLTVDADDFNVVAQILDDRLTPLTDSRRDSKVVLEADLTAGAYFVRCAADTNTSGAYHMNLFAPDVATLDVAATSSDRQE